MLNPSKTQKKILFFVLIQFIDINNVIILLLFLDLGKKVSKNGCEFSY